MGRKREGAEGDPISISSLGLSHKGGRNGANRSQEGPSLPDEWDVNDFAKRMNSGEFNDNLYGCLLGLSVQQLEDLVHVLCGR